MQNYTIFRHVNLRNIHRIPFCNTVRNKSETRDETIAASLKDILLRCSLNLDDSFWQTYDWAATMSGHLSGIAARQQNENPIAFRIYRSNHRLALKGCANESKIIGDTLSLVQDLAVFIRHFPLRMSTY